MGYIYLQYCTFVDISWITNGSPVYKWQYITLETFDKNDITNLKRM